MDEKDERGCDAGENVLKVGSLFLNGEEHLGRLVIELEVSGHVFIRNRDSGGIQNDIGQRTDIFHIETLTKV